MQITRVLMYCLLYCGLLIASVCNNVRILLLISLRHASFRNQIERAFGVMKKRFRILREPLVLECVGDMASTYYSCVALHNFIRVENKLGDEHLELEVRNEISAGIDAEPQQRILSEGDDDEDAKAWRDQIATSMLTDYAAQHHVSEL